MTDVELKPCPFCGSEAKVKFILGREAVVCQGCNAEMFGTYSPIDVLVEMWNRRADVNKVTHWQPLPEPRIEVNESRNMDDVQYTYFKYIEPLEKRVAELEKEIKTFQKGVEK